MLSASTQLIYEDILKRRIIAMNKKIYSLVTLLVGLSILLAACAAPVSQASNKVAIVVGGPHPYFAAMAP